MKNLFISMGEDISVRNFTEGPEEEALPNFNFTATVTDDTSMLAVEFFFSPRDDREDLLGSLEVSGDIMNFHFFEKA